MKIVKKKGKVTVKEYSVSCPECGSKMSLKESKHGIFYGCNKFHETGCDGSHSCHPNGKPMGIPGCKETRYWRREAHLEFDKLWTAMGFNRTQAYMWMQEIMGWDEDHAHISNLNITECKALIKAVKEEIRSAI